MGDLLFQKSDRKNPAITAKYPSSNHIPSNSPLGQFLKALPTSSYPLDTNTQRHHSNKLNINMLDLPLSRDSGSSTSSSASSSSQSNKNTTSDLQINAFTHLANGNIILSTTPTAPSSSSASSSIPTLFAMSQYSESLASSKPSSSKHQKKKRRMSELVIDTIPLNDPRRNYPRLLEMIFNRCQAEDCFHKLASICTLGHHEQDDIFTLIVSAIEKENVFGPVYSEVHSVDAAARLLSTYFLAVPDSIFVIVDCKFYKRTPNGESEIHCNFSFSGSKVYKVSYCLKLLGSV